MLDVISLDEARALVSKRFAPLHTNTEAVDLQAASERLLACDLIAVEGVPAFDRSTVDGFAVTAADTFGCSEALPALLELAGEVSMGQTATCTCTSGRCARIPTGGMVPEGADAVVMLEYCEDYGDGTIGIARPVAPGDNIAFANDDVKPGQTLICAGTRLQAHHIGTLASLGVTSVAVHGRLHVGVISTGDEIVDAAETPTGTQMRDVNAPMLAAAIRRCGAQPVGFHIVPDDYDALLATVREAMRSCDAVLISGGSSAGRDDNTARVLAELGELLFHGIAVKPGKPTMCADVDGIPAFGLPGHPVAAYFMFLELVAPLLGADMPGLENTRTTATLATGVPSNHGRSELVAVHLRHDPGGQLAAYPVHGKSGLISQLSGADGYLVIERNQEGLPAGACVEVIRF